MAVTAADPIGRKRELSAIADFLEPGGPARAVVVEGEPGIGKTSVWRAAVAAASDRFGVVQARPGESETKLAFSSLADLLGPVLETVLPELPAPQRHGLEVALLLDEPGGSRVDSRAVAAATLSALRALARTEPVLVAIDDVQWIDASSAAALEFALRRVQDEPVGLLLARRGDGSSGLERGLPSERVLTIELGALEFVALNAILEERLGEPLPRPVLRRIHELSGGNPFFALELARAPERLEAAHGLPPSLEALVSDRISSLPENTRVALVAVAAASRATIPLAESVAGAGSIAPAEQARVVEVADGAVRFAHPLLASGAYAAADPALRRDVHAQLADLVEDDEQRARHLAAAATGADESIAAALEDAAARARSRGAPADAADLGERAATLTPAANEAAALRRTADAGYYRFESGDGARALAVLGDVAARLSRGPDRARVLIQLARVSSYAEDLETATELFLQAAAEAGDDREAAARALEGAATQLFRQRRDLDAAVRYARRSAKLAGGLGDDALLATALSSQLLAEATLGRASARRTLEAALEHQDAATAERLLAQPRWSAAVARMWWDEPAAVRDTYDEVVARGREPVDEGSLAYVYVMLGQADILLGDFERAEADAAAALDIARQAGQVALVAYAHAVQALLDAHRGRADECRAAAETALELAARTRSTPAHHAAGTALGLLQLSLGQPANAAATLAPLVELARAEEIREPGLTRYVPDYVEALVETGRGGEACELLDWYEENARRLRRRSAVAAACRCRALLAASDAELEEALVFAERALAEQEALPFPFDRARSLLVYGATLRRVKRKADARTALEDARATFQSLGASAFAARAASELGRVGGRGRSDDRLTATERRIAELVAEGKSNKEVAAALFVSVKTVEANLSRTYAKLGIHSRTALAKRLESGETAGKE